MVEFVGCLGLLVAALGFSLLVGSMVGFVFDANDDLLMKVLGVGIAGIFLGFVLFLPAAISVSSDHVNQLMQQCLDDGHKQYECESIVRHAVGADQHVYVHSY